jgi:ABC-type phosphate transport system permease subunit
MDIGKSFTFAFDDENWLTKILMGGLFGLLSGILIGVPFVLGYFLETIKNVYLGNPRPLPNWGDNLGGLFSKGLKALVGTIAWSLPAILLSCVVGIVGGVTGSNYQDQQGVVPLLILCLNCLVGLYSLVVSALIPAALMRFAVSEQIGDFFKFGELFGFISRNLGNYIIALIVYWLASLVGSFGFILCLVGVFFTSFWAMLVGAHLFGQVYRLDKAA